jgi:hypothetical protein
LRLPHASSQFKNCGLTQRRPKFALRDLENAAITPAPDFGNLHITRI